MSVYERPAALLVGKDGKPSHLGAIIRFKALDIPSLTGRNVKDVIGDYEKGKHDISIRFNIEDVVVEGSKRAKELMAKGSLLKLSD